MTKNFNMGTLYAITVLFCIGLCQGINWDAFDDFSWNDVKSSVKNAYDKASDKTNAFIDDLSWEDLTDPVEDAYDKVVEKTNNAYDDLGDLFSRYRKRTSHKKSIEDIDFNSMIETTSVRKSGLSIDNKVTFEIISTFKLPVIWMITKDGKESEDLGDDQDIEDLHISTYTLRMQDIMETNRFRCQISLKNHLINIDFKKEGILNESYQRLNDIGIIFNGPFSSTLQSDGRFTFDVESSPLVPGEMVNVQYAFFYSKYSSNYTIDFESPIFETSLDDHGKTHISVEVGNHKLGEFLVFFQGGRHADAFIIYTGHRIDIPRNDPTYTEDVVLFDTSTGPTFRFPQNIQQGNLFCYAVGKPIPEVEIFKDEVKLPVVQFPFFGAAVTGALPFNGLTVDEVKGNYVCKATSGSKTIEQTIRVEELQ